MLEFVFFHPRPRDLFADFVRIRAVPVTLQGDAEVLEVAIPENTDEDLLAEIVRSVPCRVGGGIRDLVNTAATQGHLGAALDNPATGYSVVYHLEIALLFGTLVVLGPLVRLSFLKPRTHIPESGKIGLADFPT